MPASQLIEKPSAGVGEVSLAIGGMTCGSSAARVQDRLNAMDGVQATVNYATERARVTLPEVLSPDRLIEEVRAAGFTAQALGTRSDPTDQRAEADRRVRYYGRRLVVAGLLMMPLGDASIAFWLVPSLRFPGWQWLLTVMALPVHHVVRLAFLHCGPAQCRGIAQPPWTPWSRWASFQRPLGRSMPCSSTTRATRPSPSDTFLRTKRVAPSTSTWPLE